VTHIWTLPVLGACPDGGDVVIVGLVGLIDGIGLVVLVGLVGLVDAVGPVPAQPATSMAIAVSIVTSIIPIFIVYSSLSYIVFCSSYYI
jgi:hypothetical protein